MRAELRRYPGAVIYVLKRHAAGSIKLVKEIAISLK